MIWNRQRDIGLKGCGFPERGRTSASWRPQVGEPMARNSPPITATGSLGAGHAISLP